MKNFRKYIVGIITLLLCIVYFSSGAYAQNPSPLRKRLGENFLRSRRFPFSTEIGYTGVSKVRQTDTLNEYQVTLELTQHKAVPILEKHVVFIIDNSTLPSGDGSLEKQKAFLEQCVSLFFAQDTPMEIALVVVDQQGTSYGWFGQNQKDELQEHIRNIEGKGGGSYLQQGLDVGAALAEEKEGILVLLSLGNATYSHKLDSFQSVVTCGEGHNSPSWNFSPDFTTPPTRIGNGTGLSSLPRQNVPTTLCNLGKWESYSGRYPENHMMVTADYGEKLRQQGKKIYCIALGLEEGDFGMPYLSQLSEEAVAVTQQQGIETLEKAGALPKGDALSPATITIQSHPLVQVDKESILVSMGEVSHEGEEILWTTPEGSLSYVATLSVEDSDFQEELEYPVAESISLAFWRETQQAVSPIPPSRVQGKYNEIYVVGIAVDTQGKFINEEGEVVTEREQAAIAAPRVPYNNRSGVNQWAGNKQVEVPVSLLQPLEGYQLFSPEEVIREVVLTNESQRGTVYFYYIAETTAPELLEYTVHHRKEEGSLPFTTRTHRNIESGTLLTEVEDLSWVISTLEEDYYQRDIPQLPVVIQDNSVEITAVYSKRELPPLEYPFTLTTISYPDRTELHEERVVLQEEYWTVLENESYPEYSFFKAESGGTVFGLGDKVKLLPHVENTVDLYLKKREEIIPFTYYVDFYFQGELDEEESYWKTLPVGEDSLFFTPQDVFQEYILHFWEYQGEEYTENGWVTFDNPGERISVYYTEIPPVATTLEYQIEVYLEDVPLSSYWESGEVDTQNPYLLVDPPSLLDGYVFQFMEYNGVKHTTPKTLELLYEKNKILVYYKQEEEEENCYYITRYYSGEKDPHSPFALHQLPANGILTHTDIPQETFDLYSRTKVIPDPPISYSYEMEIIEEYELSTNRALQVDVFVYVDNLLDSQWVHTLPQGESVLSVEDILLSVEGEEELEHLEYGGEFKGASYPWVPNSQGEYVATYWQNQLFLYYVTAAPEKETAGYTVYYYYDLKRDNAATEQGEELVGTLITSLEKKEKEGFYYSTTEPSLPFSLKTDTVFHQYYLSGVDPIPLPNTEFHRRIPTTFIFTDSVGNRESWQEEPTISLDQWISFWQLFQHKKRGEKELVLEEITLTETVEVQGSMALLGDSGYARKDAEKANDEEVVFHQVSNTDYWMLSQDSQYSLEVVYRENKGYIEKNEEKNQKGTSNKGSGKIEAADKDTALLKKAAVSTKEATGNKEQKTIKNTQETAENNRYGNLPDTGIESHPKTQLINLLLLIMGGLLFIEVAMYKIDKK